MRPSTRLAAALSLFIVTAAPPLRAGDLSGSVRTADGRPVPQIVLILDGPSGSRTLVTGPDGRYHAQALRPGGVHRRNRCARLRPLARARGSPWPTPKRRLDLRLEPAPDARAGRGRRHARRRGALHAGRERQRAGPGPDRGARAVVPPPAPAGPARGGGRAHGRSGQPGLGLRARRRVALRPHPRGRRAREPARRRLRLRQRAAAGAGAHRGGARRGQQPLRHRRAGRRHPPRDAARRAGARPRRCARRPKAAASPGGASRAGPRGGRGRWDWNAGLAAAGHRQRSSPTARSRRRRARRRWARASASARSCGSSCAPRTASAGTPGPTAFGRPDLDAFFERTDVVAGAHLRHAPRPRWPTTSARGLAAHRAAVGEPAGLGTLHAALRRRGRRRSSSPTSRSRGLPERHRAPIRSGTSRGPGRARGTC